MSSLVEKPQPADFGADEALAARLEEAFADRRCGLFCVAVAAALAVTVGVLLYLATGSLAASLFFGVLLTVASLILVAPCAVAALCVACAVSRRWRSRQDGELAACSRYLAALERWQRGREPEPEVERALRARLHWQAADRERLLEAVLKTYSVPATRLDRALSGADLELEHEGRRLLVRVEPGDQPAPLAVGRELAMARLDRGADEAVLLAPGGLSSELAEYLQSHGLRCLELAELPR